ncbi:unnamed protein product [Pocillopora meandrina]|uniref:NACHT domain-containing protein n=1 Tax=Pocillopora meandrina TaxID=46732 RepID=A0AAU9VJ99_9CNID|nr:unnamed protein product [Pocillopora meandrina]
MFKGKHTRMLDYGRPGIGKSTFCKKAAYDWSKTLKEILKNFSILLLIKLRDVCEVGNIRDVLRASKLLASDGPISVDSLYDYIINNQDEVLLILDGYDEYSFAEEHSPILAIWKGEQLRDCHVIVTTRQLSCDKTGGPSHVQLEIQGFKSLERIKTFARKFLADEQDPDEFMHYLEEKDLLDMAEIPLLLLMLCILWKEKHHEGLPKSRADIFTQFIQTMLDHKGESHQPMPFQKVTSTEAREDLSNLGKVAFEAILQDRLYVRCSELPGNISRNRLLSEVGLFQIDTNAVFLSCSGEKKAADLLKKYPRRSVSEFFLKRERKIVAYVHEICKDEDGITFPTEMLRELISPTAESTQVTRLVDPLNEHDSETASSLTQYTDSITGPTPQSLSFVKRIDIVHIERQEIKMLADFLPLFTALRWIVITGKPFEIIDAQLTETLVSRIIFTDRLVKLELVDINLTAKPAAVIARSLHQAPSLYSLDLSENPLGEGVSVLA